MATITVTGKIYEGNLPEEMSGYPIKSAEFENITQTANDSVACMVNYPMSLPSLADTMSCRSFFEELKSGGHATVMTAELPTAGESLNWLMYYGMVLPYVDYFCADYISALAMLEPDLLDSEKDTADPELCDQMAVSLLNMGCATVIFDLQDKGVYLRSSSVRPRFEQCGSCEPSDIENWWARELYIPAQNPQASLTLKALALTAALLEKQKAEQSLAAFASAGSVTTSPGNVFSAYSSWAETDSIYHGGMDGKEA